MNEHGPTSPADDALAARLRRAGESYVASAPLPFLRAVRRRRITRRVITSASVLGGVFVIALAAQLVRHTPATPAPRRLELVTLRPYSLGALRAANRDASPDALRLPDDGGQASPAPMRAFDRSIVF